MMTGESWKHHKASNLKSQIIFGLLGSDKEESVQRKSAGLSVAPRNVTSALGSLMSSYGDDMTSSDSEGDTDGWYRKPFHLTLQILYNVFKRTQKDFERKY